MSGKFTVTIFNEDSIDFNTFIFDHWAEAAAFLYNAGFVYNDETGFFSKYTLTSDWEQAYILYKFYKPGIGESEMLSLFPPMKD